MRYSVDTMACFHYYTHIDNTKGGNIMHYSITMTGNVKTGAIPVTSSGRDTCPDTCPLKAGNGCYAENFPSMIAWDRLTRGEFGFSFDGLVKAIKDLPKGQLWRMNEKGDLSHDSGHIDTAKLQAIVKANKGKKGFTYTHHLPSVGNNLEAIQEANANGFTINLSANNLEQVDDYMAHNVPVVVVLPVNAPVVSYTPKGQKVVVCLEETKGIKCAQCGLCQQSDRSFVVGFRAHGSRKKKVELIAKAA